MYEDAWPLVESVFRFAGLPILPGLKDKVTSQAYQRNAGSRWGGAGYTGKLQARERALLHAYYAPHNQELYELVGRDMKWEAMQSPGERRELRTV